MMANRYAPIEDYGIIGDLHTVALVGKNGSIDFLCLPSFDSPSVFAALLDADGGGRFQIAPQLDDAVHRQLYLPDTNVLLTRFLSDSGVAEVSDFMPVEDAGVAHNLVRRAKTVRGEIRFGMRCEPRFDYAGKRLQTARVQQFEGKVLRRLSLRASIHLPSASRRLTHLGVCCLPRRRLRRPLGIGAAAQRRGHTRRALPARHQRGCLRGFQSDSGRRRGI